MKEQLLQVWCSEQGWNMALEPCPDVPGQGSEALREAPWLPACQEEEERNVEVSCKTDDTEVLSGRFLCMAQMGLVRRTELKVRHCFLGTLSVYV